MNITMFLPIFLAVASDIFYQICCKSMPGNLNPYASLTVTYLVAGFISFCIYEISTAGGNIVQELHHINWTAFVLGIAIVGLEVGSIFMYKAGWNINTGYIVKSIILAIMLIFVGYAIYKEPVKASKIAGVAVCLIGLYLINK